jgi:two-component system LytT family response regulator
MTQKLKTIIVDDEKYSRENVRNALSNHHEILDVFAEANSVESAFALIEQERPDLVFLDINLGDGTGFDLLEKLQYRDFRLVFITAYDQYAIRAMKFSALDYLLKPLDKNELNQVMHRILMEEFKERKQIENLLQNVKNPSSKKIAIPTNEGFNIHEINDVRCQSNGNYTMIYFSDSSKILSSKTLKFFDDMFEGQGFERVHNSHLVNMNHIKKYINTDGGFLKMSDESEIPISQRKKAQVIQALEKL